MFNYKKYKNDVMLHCNEVLAQVAILQEVIPEGMDIDELIKRFKAGWQLVPPPPPSKIIEDIIDEFLASP